MRRTLAWILLLPWLAAGAAWAQAPARKTPAKKEGTGSWAVILASRDSQALAEAALPALAAAARNWVEPAPGFPKVVASETLKGLAPGHHLVLLGHCDDKDAAVAAASWVRLGAQETYPRQLGSKVPSACPRHPGARSEVGRATARLGVLPARGDGTRLEIARGDPLSRSECQVSKLVLQARRGAELLEEQVFDAECVGACTRQEKAEGARALREIERDIARGEATESQLDYDFTGCRGYQADLAAVLQTPAGPVALLVEETPGPHSGTDHAYLLATGCEGLAVSDPLDLDGTLVPPHDRGLDDVVVLPLAAPAEGVHRFQLAAPPPDAAGRPRPLLEVTFHTGTCAWQSKVVGTLD